MKNINRNVVGAMVLFTTLAFSHATMANSIPLNNSKNIGAGNLLGSQLTPQQFNFIRSSTAGYGHRGHYRGRVYYRGHRGGYRARTVYRGGYRGYYRSGYRRYHRGYYRRGVGIRVGYRPYYRGYRYRYYGPRYRYRHRVAYPVRRTCKAYYRGRVYYGRYRPGRGCYFYGYGRWRWY